MPTTTKAVGRIRPAARFRFAVEPELEPASPGRDDAGTRQRCVRDLDRHATAMAWAAAGDEESAIQSSTRTTASPRRAANYMTPLSRTGRHRASPEPCPGKGSAASPD
jgi:hypothetical protein